MDLPVLGIAHRVVQHFKGSSNRVDVGGPFGASRALLAHQTASMLDVPLLVLTDGRIASELVHEDLETFTGPNHALMLPAWEVLPDDIMDPADDIVAERLDTLRSLIQDVSLPLCLTLSIRSLLQRVPEPGDVADHMLVLREGQEYDLDDLLMQLIGLGYNRELMVEQRGEISLRGCILDVFPITSDLPFRFEFFGDELESIRKFEPETQRSVGHVHEVEVLPRSEKKLLAQEGDTSRCVLDYLPENTLIAWMEPTSIDEAARKVSREIHGNPWFLSWDVVSRQLERYRTLAIHHVAPAKDREIIVETQAMRSMKDWTLPATDFWEQLDLWEREDYSVFLLCNNPGERKRLYDLLEEHNRKPEEDAFRLQVTLGRLSAGFDSPDDKLAVLSEREVFGRHYVRRKRRRFEAGNAISSFGDLTSGDYVVHSVHGIGRYIGLRRFEDKSGDFLVVQYAKGDTVYVPVTAIDQIQKYTGGDGTAPKVDRLGGATWSRTKARVKKAVKDMTEELVRMYAARGARQGHAYSPDTPWQIEFEDAFEYEETPDQARAILEVKRDMESPKPMDRVLCGDVGYGKTEVALRAAFKAVQDGKQAAMLVPTTVLAEQHYLTFTERLADYPVRTGLLCRFRTPKEQRETLDQMKSGEVDIVVGTHRLLSKDVKFHNIGLLVIDEEHRFGVAQKERLKALRNHVDVLTMTATPIPRTLNMALMGVRDLSLINTAPNDRLPVHTCITEYSESLIREAIRREIDRQGQVFFLHNRVQTILSYAKLVSDLVPDARVGVGHGQMPEGQLEDVMSRFIHGQIDVLVCTTIIGAGIDIPNANTIIINNADHFGLSELYQLRGRVGRYKHRAFAYLMVSPDRALTEVAQKRLKALEDFSTLGAGFRIAMRDMEIRGCGNILGAEQHGHITAVGMETYAQLVQEAIAELKGEPVHRRVLPQFEIAADAYIPAEYVQSEAQKITLYKRIASSQDIEEVIEMRDELADRYGPIPIPVRRLLDIMETRTRAAELGIRRIITGNGSIVLEFETDHSIARGARVALKEHFGNQVTFAWQGMPSITYKTDADSSDTIIKSTRHILDAIAEAAGV